MGEFFRGWRRKVGLLTLLVALVAMVGWVRTFVFVDVLVIQSGRFRVEEIVSLYGSICWTSENLEEPQARFVDWGTTRPNRPYHETEAATLDTPEHRHPIQLPVAIHSTFAPVENERYCCGFGTFDYLTSSEPLRVWMMPYWSIVLALTALSAYLLLSKPKKSNQKKIPEFIANKLGATS